MSTKQTIMIMAAGTGGHVFPGLALAESLTKKDIKVIWLGTPNGMEQKWVEKSKIPFYKISIAGLRGNGLVGWLKSPFNIMTAFWQARKIMQSLKPNLVLGMGGFVCGPGGLAAKSLGISLVLHEQNAIPGMTNKWLAIFANKIITAFPQKKITGKKVCQIGNPIRAGLEGLATPTSQKPFNILVIGGSRGALILNEKVPQALALLSAEQRPKIVHQTGQKTLKQAQDFYYKAKVKAQIVPFIDDMAKAYSRADLVICRSGALTISELMAVARPAIMIPYPYAVDDHQTKNAKVLVELQGGEIIKQTELTPQILAQKLTYWLDEIKLKSASKSIRKGDVFKATDKITHIILQELKQGQK